MENKLETCTWELTMGCNMRCAHCASSCAEMLPDELTTGEALRLVDEIAALKPEWVTLTGGEPLLRRDWHLIVKKLRSYGIDVGMITNGTLVDKEAAQKMKDSDLNYVSISVDGTKDFHDSIRRANSFTAAMTAFETIKETVDKTIHFAHTTILKGNIGLLPELKEELVSHGVTLWQWQIGVPEGNMAGNKDALIDPSDIVRLIDYAYEETLKGDIGILLSDNIGYYTMKEMESRRMALNWEAYPLWRGCKAGIKSLGILQNGDIVGCVSMRGRDFIEGNVKDRPLAEIWNDPNSFAWRRKFEAEKLGGKCGSCVYRDHCHGGCSSTRIANTGSLYAENIYCAYHASN